MFEVKYKTQYIDINLLKVHPENPRLIKDVPFQKLCESIKENPEYFETRPIICDINYVIWAGNQRYRAGKEIGLIKVPAVILDLPEKKLREIMVRDNVQNGEWDFDLLSSHFEIPELEMFGVDMASFGVFEEKETVNHQMVECPKCKNVFGTKGNFKKNTPLSPTEPSL